MSSYRKNNNLPLLSKQLLESSFVIVEIVRLILNHRLNMQLRALQTRAFFLPGMYCNYMTVESKQSSQLRCTAATQVSLALHHFGTEQELKATASQPLLHFFQEPTVQFLFLHCSSSTVLKKKKSVSVPSWQPYDSLAIPNADQQITLLIRI